MHPGDAVNLSWQVSGDFSALQLSPADGLPSGVDPGNIQASGVQVTPSGSCDVEYTLTAVAKDSSQPAATARFTVKVQAAAPATRSVLAPRFTDAPTSAVTAGKPFTLSWTIDGWTSDDSQNKTPVLLHVDQDPGDGNGGQDKDLRPPSTHEDGSGSTTITPTNAGTFKYTLYAGSGDGAPSCQTSVTVEATSQPVVPHLSRDSQDAVSRGATFTLQWTIDGYQPGTPVSLLVDGDVGDPEIHSGMPVDADGNGKGSRPVVAGKTGDFGFRLVVGSSDTGATSEKLTVSVQPAGPPTPRFTDPPATPVNVGKPFTLRWTIADLQKDTPVILQVDPDPGDGNGTQDRLVGPPTTRLEDGVGSIEITPTKVGSFKYTLCAGTGDGAPTDQAAVVVEYGVPRALSFTARPEPDDGQQHQSSLQVDADSPVVLSWTAENCEKVEITPGIGQLEASTGQYTIEHAKGSVDYSLVAIAGDQRVPYSKPVHVSTHAEGDVYSHHVFVSAGMPEIKWFAIGSEDMGTPSAGANRCDFVPAGKKVVLAWEVDGDCDSLQIDPGNHNVQGCTGPDGKGSFPIDPSEVTKDAATFRLTLSADEQVGDGKTTISRTSEVKASIAPAIQDFHAEKDEVEEGKRVQLVWTMSGYAPGLYREPGHSEIPETRTGTHTIGVVPSEMPMKDRDIDGRVGYTLSVCDEDGVQIVVDGKSVVTDAVWIKVLDPGKTKVSTTITEAVTIFEFEPHHFQKGKYLSVEFKGNLQAAGQFSRSNETTKANEAPKAWLDEMFAALPEAVFGDPKVNNEKRDGQLKCELPDQVKKFEVDPASWSELEYEEGEWERERKDLEVSSKLNFKVKHVRTNSELVGTVILFEADLKKGKVELGALEFSAEHQFDVLKVELSDGKTFTGFLQLELALTIKPEWEAIAERLGSEGLAGIAVVLAAVWAGFGVKERISTGLELDNLPARVEATKAEFIRCFIDGLAGKPKPSEPNLQEIYSLGEQVAQDQAEQLSKQQSSKADQELEKVHSLASSHPEVFQDPDAQKFYDMATRHIVWAWFANEHTSETDHYWAWVKIFNEDPVRRRREFYLKHPSKNSTPFFVEFCEESIKIMIGDRVSKWQNTFAKMASGKWGTQDDVDALVAQIKDLTDLFSNNFMSGLGGMDASEEFKDIWELGQKLRKERKQAAVDKGLPPNLFDDGLDDDLDKHASDFIERIRNPMGLAARDWLWIQFAAKHTDAAERRSAWEKIVGKSPEQSKSDDGNDLFDTYAP